GKSLAQIETRLVSKMRDGPDAGAVLMLSTVFENCFKNVVILFHKSRQHCRLICGKALPFRPALSVAFLIDSRHCLESIGRKIKKLVTVRRNLTAHRAAQPQTTVN